MGGLRDGKEYFSQHPDEAQVDAVGRPITAGDSYYFNPTAGRIALERAYFETALANGSEGICPEEPEYFARAGYEPAFKSAWQQSYKTPWLDPASNISARSGRPAYGAIGDKSDLPTAEPARRYPARGAPNGSAAQPASLCAFRESSARTTRLPASAVQDVVGQVWTGSARTPVRYVGLRQDHTFSLAYLEYSSLYNLIRGTGRRLWFVSDPLEDDPSRSPNDYKSHYELTVAASLLFPEVDLMKCCRGRSGSTVM